ncbi:1,4-alpha-glucan branching enzyme, partial [Pirellulaceae bacterium]|nr:1,4-alpha-glucan branching enzyme [Pirellulaceae bacterium]
MKSDLELDSVRRLLNSEIENPRSLLGPHIFRKNGRKAVSVRTFQPSSRRVWVCHQSHESPVPMQQIHPAGLFEATIPIPENQESQFSCNQVDMTQINYQIKAADQTGQVKTMHDPYAFDTFFTDLDLHLFGEGNNLRIYDKLGAQSRTINGVTGVNFAVWAPNAKSVSVVGDFNEWDGRTHAMNKLVPSGIWELFVPELPSGTLYKFRVRDANGCFVDKTDPYGFAAEVPPRTASIVTDMNAHQWQDSSWMERRRNDASLDRPISVYEVHL